MAENEHVVISISDKYYALPVTDIDVVVSLHTDEISSIPFDTSRQIHGIFSYKGSIVCIVNCRDLDINTDNDHREHLTAVLLHYMNNTFAIVVDSVITVKTVTPDDDIRILDTRWLYYGDGNADY